ncbi:hypothetical protein [Egbenema bharatensis]|uniref:hypothetical protein n=1 Tax=Egbenema bharatensis TaxID=3463334 RepID=UPI003A891C89
MPNQAIYSRSANILKRFSSQSGNTMILLYEPSAVTPWDLVATTRYYGFVSDFRLKVQISSIAESQIPNLDITSSRAERLAAVRNMEWNSPRKEFQLFLETSTQSSVHVASISLLNRQPYYHINLLPYFTDNGILNISSDCRILGRIVNAGWGLLQSNDEVVCFGSVKEEVTTLPENERTIQYCQPHSWTIGTTSLQILPSNPNRLQTTLVNRSTTATVFINYGNTAVAGQGIALLPGGSYEINLTNPYEGVISAIATASGTLLAGLECV